MNSFDVSTTRRLAIGLMAIAGSLLFAALNLLGAGISAGDKGYAAGISGAVAPLGLSAATGFIAFICAELADHPATPAEGHPHSKRNYVQTAFALLAVSGLGSLVWGWFVLLTNANVRIPG